MMKILVVANQKGGVGKTATVVNFAQYMSEKMGLRVAVIDLDTQGNATYSLSPAALVAATASELFKPGFACGAALDGSGVLLFPSDAQLADMERVPPAEASAAFKQSVDAIGKTGIDVCLIDTAPSLGNAMISALLSATHLLSPIELEAYSIQGIAKMLTVVGNVRAHNSALTFLGMLPSKVDSRNKRHADHLRELHAHYANLVLPVTVPLRTSIADALATRRPLWTIKKSAARKAAGEMRAMIDHVTTAMLGNN
jgi:chromosome partitioning protein